jgi:uncharacterized membrane protein YccC
LSEPSKRRWRLEGAWASAAFAGRTTLAAIAAMAAASLLGLSHLHWAAMTVWLVAQPTRGLLLEKSFLRVAGTLSGAAVAFGLHSVFPDRTLALVTGLTIWTGLCAPAWASSPVPSGPMDTCSPATPPCCSRCLR